MMAITNVTRLLVITLLGGSKMKYFLFLNIFRNFSGYEVLRQKDDGDFLREVRETQTSR